MGEAELQAQNSRLRVLAETSHAFSELVTRYDALLEQVAERLSLATGDTCLLSLISSDGVWLDKAAIYNPDPEITRLANVLFASHRQKVGEPGAGTVAATGEPLELALDREALRAVATAELLPLVDKHDVSSVLILPLTSRGTILGTIALARHGDRASYTAADRQLVEDLASRSALAIDNARLYRELEQRVAARTAELEATTRELETFSYSISHDLRAPLRAIDGFSRIIGEDHAPQLDDEGRRLLGIVLANAEKMSVLIEALLDFSRIGRTPMAFETVDMTALARSAAEEVSARSSRIELAVPALPETRCNPQLMRMVWVSLLGNAVKYTRARERAVIAVAATRDDRETVFSVRDNGVGFDMRHAEKLFGVFQRLHDAKQYEGIGVGLALVQRIVVRHGGRVWATAATDQGATFSFAVPHQ